MTVTIEVEHEGVMLKPYWFKDSPRLKPDRFGNRGGYRVTPPGADHNKASASIFFRTLEEVAQHLLENPSWGLRFDAPSGANIFVQGILINGKPR